MTDLNAFPWPLSWILLSSARSWAHLRVNIYERSELSWEGIDFLCHVLYALMHSPITWYMRSLEIILNASQPIPEFGCSHRNVAPENDQSGKNFRTHARSEYEAKRNSGSEGRIQGFQAAHWYAVSSIQDASVRMCVTGYFLSRVPMRKGSKVIISSACLMRWLGWDGVARYIATRNRGNATRLISMRLILLSIVDITTIIWSRYQPKLTWRRWTEKWRRKNRERVYRTVTVAASF